MNSPEFISSIFLTTFSLQYSNDLIACFCVQFAIRIQVGILFLFFSLKVKSLNQNDNLVPRMALPKSINYQQIERMNFVIRIAFPFMLHISRIDPRIQPNILRICTALQCTVSKQKRIRSCSSVSLFFFLFFSFFTGFVQSNTCNNKNLFEAPFKSLCITGFEQYNK